MGYTSNPDGETGIVFGDVFPRYQVQWQTANGQSFINVIPVVGANQSEVESALSGLAAYIVANLGAIAEEGSVTVERFDAPATDSLYSYQPPEITATLFTSTLVSGQTNIYQLHVNNSYTANVSLSAQPASNVTVTVARNANPPLGNPAPDFPSLTPATLTFTPSNWATPQTVTLTTCTTMQDGNNQAIISMSAPGYEQDSGAVQIVQVNP